MTALLSIVQAQERLSTPPTRPHTTSSEDDVVQNSFHLALRRQIKIFRKEINASRNSVKDVQKKIAP